MHSHTTKACTYATHTLRTTAHTPPPHRTTHTRRTHDARYAHYAHTHAHAVHQTPAHLHTSPSPAQLLSNLCSILGRGTVATRFISKNETIFVNAPIVALPYNEVRGQKKNKPEKNVEEEEERERRREEERGKTGGQRARKRGKLKRNSWEHRANGRRNNLLFFCFLTFTCDKYLQFDYDCVKACSQCMTVILTPNDVTTETGEAIIPEHFPKIDSKTCQYCDTVYCSYKCQSDAWTQHHQYICTGANTCNNSNNYNNDNNTSSNNGNNNSNNNNSITNDNTHPLLHLKARKLCEHVSYVHQVVLHFLSTLPFSPCPCCLF